jgi:ubiquitin C-terminal hydrolase
MSSVYCNDSNRRANTLIDEANNAWTEQGRVSAQNKLDSFLERKAPPVSTGITLNRQVSRALDRKDPSLEKICNTAFNNGLSYKSREDVLKHYEKSFATSQPGPIRGIPNQGNTCFINAGLQLLMHTPALLRAVIETYQELSKDMSIPEEKRMAYKELLKIIGTYKINTPRPLANVNISSLRVLIPDVYSMEEDSMGDVTEFLAAIIDPINSTRYPDLFFTIEERKTLVPLSQNKLEPELQEILKKKQGEFEALKGDEDWVSQNYTTIPVSGVIQNPILSSSIILPLSQGDGALSGQTLIDDYFSKKQTKSEQEPALYTSGKSVEYFSPTSSQITLKTAPPYLNIVLNRFSTDMYGRKTKINREVMMPEKVTVYVDGKPLVYQLQSVALHTGLHYIALVKENGSFKKADDETISNATSRDIGEFTNRGYMYIYKKLSSSRDGLIKI